MLIMTGSKLRHLFFASEMLRRFPTAQVLIEEFHPETGKNYTKGEVTPSMAAHFANFDRVESSFFSDELASRLPALEKAIVKRLPMGTINEPEAVSFITELKPQAIIVYSTSIIKEPLISAFAGRIFNLHAGLSPFYRGAGTNLFPFYNDELEYVGMTVHHLDAGIDSGDILLQGRPQFSPGDDTHTISCKNVVLGAELMWKVAEAYLKTGSAPRSRKQRLEIGKLYLRKHFNDEVLEKIRKLLAAGMVERYLAAPKRVDIVEW